MRVSIGPAKRLAATIPAINVQLDVSGDARVKYEHELLDMDVTLGTARVTDGRAEMEVGITLLTPRASPGGDVAP